jgi:putative transposase
MTNGITISMDGRGRALDNIFVERLMKQLAIRLSEQTTLAKSLVIWRSVKYEDVYLKGYGNPMELMIGLTEYFVFYNGERPHQSLGNRTPAEVYATGSNGGARIIDKFSKNGAASCSCVKDGQTSLN